MRLKLSLLICLFFSLTAATFYYLHYLKPAFVNKGAAQAALVISFDDQNVSEWYEQRLLFKEYGVRATFFITEPDSLNNLEVEMLKTLVADGHEIGSHGAHHLNSLNYIKEHSLAEYVDYEVVPSIKALSEKGFVPVTFAYPYGANSDYIDHELLKYFYLLRGDSWKVKNKEIDELDKIFYSYDGRRVINGLGIDHGSGVSLDDIKQAFKRAAERNEAVVLYAHAINNSKSTYSVTPDMLEEIFKISRHHQLASYTFKDLALN